MSNLVLRSCSLGDTIQYLDDRGNPARGRCVGWRTNSYSQMHIVLMAGDSEVEVPLGRVTARTRNGQTLSLRKQPVTIEV